MTVRIGKRPNVDAEARTVVLFVKWVGHVTISSSKLGDPANLLLILEKQGQDNLD